MKDTLLFSLTDYLTTALSHLQGIYIFGSYGTRAFNQESDIDLAVLCKEHIASTHRFELIQKLGILAKRNVDLVDLRNVNLVLQMQIVSQGKRAMTYDQEACESFEDLTFAKYLRFSEFRAPLINDIQQRGSVY